MAISFLRELDTTLQTFLAEKDRKTLCYFSIQLEEISSITSDATEQNRNYGINFGIRFPLVFLYYATGKGDLSARHMSKSHTKIHHY